MAYFVFESKIFIIKKQKMEKEKRNSNHQEWSSMVIKKQIRFKPMPLLERLERLKKRHRLCCHTRLDKGEQS